MKKKRRRIRFMLTVSRYISLIFTPFYLPVMGLVALFLFSYLSMMPLLYQLRIVLMVWLLTCFLPSRLIHLYRHYQSWSLLRLITREGRVVPYLISILCYFVCILLMDLQHIPHLMSSIVLAALAIQIICAFINNWWKISTHTAAIGGATGVMMVFSLIFGFYSLGWLCFLLLIAGVVGTSRTLLRLHSLGQVVGGYLIGLFAGFITVLLG